MYILQLFLGGGVGGGGGGEWGYFKFSSVIYSICSEQISYESKKLLQQKKNFFDC